MLASRGEQVCANRAASTCSSPPAGPAASPTARSPDRLARAPCFGASASTCNPSARHRSAAPLCCRERSVGRKPERPPIRHTRGTGTPTARTCSHTNAGLSASHAERGLVRRCQAARPRGPAAPAARPGRAAVAGCLQAGQSAATSKRTGLSLSWRSSHQRPYPSRCWKGRQPGISALRPDCCINVEFRKSTELVAGAPAPRCRSARRTSSSTRMRAACWGTQWPASSKRTGRVARHQSDSQRS
jgi:hypothetical protein